VVVLTVSESNETFESEGTMSSMASETLPAAHVNDAPLTGLDRCDSCGAQAYIRAELATGELLFCAHHGARFKESMADKVLSWHDETSRLFEEARA
jgi:hypothetical protein